MWAKPALDFQNELARKLDSSVFFSELGSQLAIGLQLDRPQIRGEPHFLAISQGNYNASHTA